MQEDQPHDGRPEKAAKREKGQQAGGGENRKQTQGLDKSAEVAAFVKELHILLTKGATIPPDDGWLSRLYRHDASVAQIGLAQPESREARACATLQSAKGSCEHSTSN